eukprot:gnl/TRDRNA2_/TRDRNA2_75549_c0_seq1.p1 gnl/TRDRNA2_/TRDRNA2_75549_c0~~gnl/TRDRNA2_/TRDRNA2_75549_c0_seq1.p1  ORF type:complete len:382 (-),score=59.88 gnl/TRDRNA2_/TRDRNA2_75549_c0_seq1:81-1103(-)
MGSRSSVDVAVCVQKGLVGALGAIPGTLISYPMDVVKIRMQTTEAGSCLTAIRQIALASSSSAHAGLQYSVPGNFYRGLTPAIEMRFMARGPMFLLSELFTELVQGHTSLEGSAARFVGSVGSGYFVGLFAGIAEYRKKLLSQQAVPIRDARWSALWRTASAAGQRKAFIRRLHAAGVCNMVYDTSFFTMQSHLQLRGVSVPTSYGAAASIACVLCYPLDTAVARMLVVPPAKSVPLLTEVVAGLFRWHGSCVPTSYGAAASIACVLCYPLDTAVARMLVVPPAKSVPLLTEVVAGLFRWHGSCVPELRPAFRGLSVRLVEFGVCFFVTGVVSTFIIAPQ